MGKSEERKSDSSGVSAAPTVCTRDSVCHQLLGFSSQIIQNQTAVGVHAHFVLSKVMDCP